VGAGLQQPRDGSCRGASTLARSLLLLLLWWGCSGARTATAALLLLPLALARGGGAAPSRTARCRARTRGGVLAGLAAVLVLQVDAQGLAPASLLAPIAPLAVIAHARPAALGAVVPHPAVGTDRGAPAALHLALAALPAVGADQGAPAALHLALAALPAVGADRGAPAALHLTSTGLAPVHALAGLFRHLEEASARRVLDESEPRCRAVELQIDLKCIVCAKQRRNEITRRARQAAVGAVVRHGNAPREPLERASVGPACPPRLRLPCPEGRGAFGPGHPRLNALRLLLRSLTRSPPPAAARRSRRGPSRPVPAPSAWTRRPCRAPSPPA